MQVCQRAVEAMTLFMGQKMKTCRERANRALVKATFKAPNAIRISNILRIYFLREYMWGTGACIRTRGNTGK